MSQPVRRLATAGLVLALAALPHAHAQTDAREALAAAEAALSEAEAALAEAGEGEERLVALGLAVRAQEETLAAYRRVFRLVTRRAEALDDGIAAGGERLSALLGVLQSLSSAPRSALFAFPGGPVDAARAQILLAAVTPALEQQRIGLASELSQLRALHLEQEQAREGARAALGGLQALRADTAIALDERRRNLPPRRLMQMQAEQARTTAESIGALAEALDEALATNPGVAADTPEIPFAARKETLSLPVPGRVAGGFGAADPWGNPGAGLVIDAPAYASVSSPVDATVRFAGALEGYGTVIIIEPEPGWLITIAGLGRVDRAIGDLVSPGETVGVMDETLPPSPEILLAQGDVHDLIETRQLYLELRRDGVPVDPAPWFAGLD